MAVVEGMGRVTNSLVQSSGDAETQSQRETGGFRRARGERNFKGLVVQGRCAGLGQVHVSGTDGLESKSAVDRQVCGTTDPAQGRRRGAKVHRRTEGEGSQYPMGKVEQPSSDEQAQDGRIGKLCAEWPVNAVIWCSPDEQPELVGAWGGRLGIVAALYAMRKESPSTAEALGRSRREWARIWRWWRAGRPMLSCFCTAAMLCRRGRLAQIEMSRRRSRGGRSSG